MVVRHLLLVSLPDVIQDGTDQLQGALHPAFAGAGAGGDEGEEAAVHPVVVIHPLHVLTDTAQHYKTAQQQQILHRLCVACLHNRLQEGS